MIWIKADDNIYYDRDDEKKFSAASRLVEDFKKEYPSLNYNYIESCLENVYLDPSKEELKQITNKGGHSKGCVISPLSPSEYGYEDMGFFTEIELRGGSFPLTLEQVELKIPIQDVLSKKIGLVFVEPKKTLERDYAGAEYLKEDLKYMRFLESFDYKRIASIFLFGVAGGGKSHFVECFAGTTGKRMAILDLPHFMTLPHPTNSLDMLFDVLSLMKENFILFMDEMEKMFEFGGDSLVAKQVLGKLLTKLNDLYADKDSNVTFVGTANNITPIITHNPELLRRGRFDRLYFINYPSNKSTIELVNVFKKIFHKDMKIAIERQYQFFKDKDVSSNAEGIDKIFRHLQEAGVKEENMVDIFLFDFDTEKMIRYVEDVFSQSKVSEKGSFVYTPPEISSVISELFGRYVYLLGQKVEQLSDGASAFFVDGQSVSPINILENFIGLSEVDFVQSVANKIIPLQISAQKGVLAQLAQSISFKKGSELEQFINIS